MSALSNKLNGHSGNDDLRTPQYLWYWLHRRFRFNIDAAASQENALTTMYCTADGTFRKPDKEAWDDRDGLTYPWREFRVFVNPPYSRPMLGRFIDKAIAERDSAEIIVMLVKCDTSTANFRKLAAHAHIEFLNRVRYEGADGKLLPGATFASCIAIIRPTEPKP